MEGFRRAGHIAMLFEKLILKSKLATLLDLFLYQCLLGQLVAIKSQAEHHAVVKCFQ